MAGAQPYLAAGGIQDARGAQEVAAGQQQFYAPWDVLSRYGNILGQVATPGGSMSGTSASTQPIYTNQWANAAGGAVAGAQLGRQVGGWFGSGATSPNVYGGSSSGGFGTGIGFGNQDYGQYF